MTAAQSNRTMSSPALAHDLMLWLADIRVCSFRVPMQIRGTHFPFHASAAWTYLTLFVCSDAPKEAVFSHRSWLASATTPCWLYRDQNKLPMSGGFADAISSTAKCETVPEWMMAVDYSRQRPRLYYIAVLIVSKLFNSVSLKLLSPIEIL